MSIKITYFVHGTTTDNEKKISSGWADVGLSELGIKQSIVGHKAPQLALDVLITSKSWKQALAEDWHKTKSWQPGWKYGLK